MTQENDENKTLNGAKPSSTPSSPKKTVPSTPASPKSSGSVTSPTTKSTTYTLHPQLALLPFLHVTKYSSTSSGCVGVLLGRSSGSSSEVELTAVVPLFHSVLPMASNWEIALQMVSTFATTRNETIQGFYISYNPGSKPTSKSGIDPFLDSITTTVLQQQRNNDQVFVWIIDPSRGTETLFLQPKILTKTKQAADQWDAKSCTNFTIMEQSRVRTLCKKAVTERVYEAVVDLDTHWDMIAEQGEGETGVLDFLRNAAVEEWLRVVE